MSTDINSEILCTEQCAAVFRRVVGACFLFFFDIRVGLDNVRIDLLPDFIGWIIIASALTTILDLSPKVAGIKTLANWLALLSFFDLVEVQIYLFKSETGSIWIPATLPVYLIATVVECIFIWKACGLIVDMAAACGDTIISRAAEARRKIYIIYSILSIFSFPAVYFLNYFIALQEILPIFIFVMFPLGLVVFFLMAGLLKGTESMCRRRIPLWISAEEPGPTR